jgi:heterodisulfide reductase subunit B
VLTACASCYARLRTANYHVLNDPKQRERAERITGEPYDGTVAVHHILDALVYQLGLPAIHAAVRRPLTGLRVACYYGCLLTRPPEVVAFEDAEHPTSMEKLVTALGGEPVEWPYKTECCGASLSMTHSNIVGRLGHRLVDMAQQAGAQCIAVACPLCQVNLDLRQADARKNHGELPETPALYITQLLGLALGLSPKKLGLQALSVSFEGLLQNLPSPSGRGVGGEGCDAAVGSCSCPCPHPNPLPEGEGTDSAALPKRNVTALPKGEGTVGVAGGNR